MIKNLTGSQYSSLRQIAAKDLLVRVWNQIMSTVHLLERRAFSMWGQTGLSPSHHPLRFTVSTPLPVHPLNGVPVPQSAGERGHRVKVFSSLDLGACWERLGERMVALELGLGVRILILLKNSWFEFLLTSLSPPSPHKSREMKNLFRGEPVK